MHTYKRGTTAREICAKRLAWTSNTCGLSLLGLLAKINWRNGDRVGRRRNTADKKMAPTASKEQTSPKVGVRFTIRFQAEPVEEHLISRDWFCKNVILEQLRLKVEDVYCIQWNQPEKAFDVTLVSEDMYSRVAEACRKEAGTRFIAGYKILNLDRPNFRTVTVHTYNPFVTDLALVAFLGQHGEVVTSARYVKDMRGFWTGRRQFQVLLNPDPEGHGGLKHPPALFSLGGDRGYLFYARQPAFCRRCRQSGHTEAGCSGAGCRTCGQGGHDAKECTGPKACHGCGEMGHLYRNCPSRRRTFAEVAKSNGEPEKAKHPGKGPLPAENGLCTPVLAAPATDLSEIGTEEVPLEKGTKGSATRDTEAQVTCDNAGGEFPPISPDPATSKIKKGARKGSQVFGGGKAIRSGESKEEGHSKKSKGEGNGAEGQDQEKGVDGGMVSGVEQQRRAAEEGGHQEQDGGNIGLGKGGDIGGDPCELPNVGCGLELDLPPDLLNILSPMGEDAYEGPNRPSTSPNPVPFSWADEMEREDFFSQ